MKKPYELQEDGHMNSMVHDESLLAYAVKEQITTPMFEGTVNLASDLPPYTMQELNARIDEAEEQIARGEVFSHEEVMAEMKNLIASWS